MSTTNELVKIISSQSDAIYSHWTVNVQALSKFARRRERFSKLSVAQCQDLVMRDLSTGVESEEDADQ